MTTTSRSELNTDEKRVLTLAKCSTFGFDAEVKDRMHEALFRRMTEGVDDYGHLDLATDERDFAADGGDEACDGIDYCAMGELHAEMFGPQNGITVDAFRRARQLFAEAWALLGGRTTGARYDADDLETDACKHANRGHVDGTRVKASSSASTTRPDPEVVAQGVGVDA